MTKLLLLAVAGAAGTLSRFGVNGLMENWLGRAYPWGTLAANAVGCLLAGLLWAYAGSRWQVPQEIRTIVLIGFVGAFTTFSSLILDVGNMVERSQWVPAVGYFALQNVCGFSFLFLGLLLGRQF